MSPGYGEVLPSLEDFLRRPEWYERAACAGIGVDAFGGYGKYRRDLCEGCAVRQECLEAALVDDSLVGLWGGTTEPSGGSCDGREWPESRDRTPGASEVRVAPRPPGEMAAHPSPG